jgi:hypothetical protein
MEISLILLPGNADVLLRESNDLCLFGNRVGALSGVLVGPAGYGLCVGYTEPNVSLKKFC